MSEVRASLKMFLLGLGQVFVGMARVISGTFGASQQAQNEATNRSLDADDLQNMRPSPEEEKKKNP